MSYFSSYSAEVQDYLKACEHFLAAAHIHNRRFSEEELQMVESYSTDVAKIHTAFLHPKNPLISPRLFPSQ